MMPLLKRQKLKGVNKMLFGISGEQWFTLLLLVFVVFGAVILSHRRQIKYLNAQHEVFLNTMFEKDSNGEHTIAKFVFITDLDQTLDNALAKREKLAQFYANSEFADLVKNGVMDMDHALKLEQAGIDLNELTDDTNTYVLQVGAALGMQNIPGIKAFQAKVRSALLPPKPAGKSVVKP